LSGVKPTLVTPQPGVTGCDGAAGAVGVVGVPLADEDD
jgi:hypothetical protein